LRKYQIENPAASNWYLVFGRKLISRFMLQHSLGLNGQANQLPSTKYRFLNPAVFLSTSSPLVIADRELRTPPAAADDFE
jgi:hypothetical protein